MVASAFVESGGIVEVEMESTNYSGDWQVETGAKSSGNAYLMYHGSNNFNTPAVDTITVPVVINDPGAYRFVWRTIIGEGDSPTEANDSWLKIQSDNFYGKKISDAQGETPVGHIVCPKGQSASNSCIGAEPEGSSSQGWFKVYRTGGPIDEWVWRSFTSDNDPHAVFATFDTAGQYDILIAGRSFGHGIDRFVLFTDDNASNDIAEADATSLDAAESSRQ